MHNKQSRIQVIFRIISTEIDPNKVTKLLGIQPTKTYEPQYHPLSKQQHVSQLPGFWGIDSVSCQASDLDGHLRALLTVLEPKRQQIRELSETMEVSFYCSLFEVASADISNAVIAQIADIGASLTLAMQARPEDR